MVDALFELPDEQLLAAFRDGIHAAADVLVWRHHGRAPVDDLRPAAIVWAELLTGKCTIRHEEDAR